MGFHFILSVLREHTPTRLLNEREPNIPNDLLVNRILFALSSLISWGSAGDYYRRKEERTNLVKSPPLNSAELSSVN